MGLNELIRQYTYEIKDEIELLNKNIEDLNNELSAIETRKKQISSDIKHINIHENQIKILLQDISRSIDDRQRIMDELERQRQEKIEELLNLREEQSNKEKEIKQLRDNLFKAYGQIKKEEENKNKIEYDLNKKRVEIEQKRLLYKQRQIEAFKTFLINEEDSLHLAFKSLEEKDKYKKAYEEFNRARQSDYKIAELYEQREELTRLIKEAKLESTKAYLRDKLSIIEGEIDKIFPGALYKVYHNTTEQNIIEIILTFDNDQKAIFWLPISNDSLDKLERGEISENINHIVCFLWNMIKQLDLMEENGEFSLIKDFLCFKSTLSREDISILGQFSVRCNDTELIRCIFSEAPPMLREALIYED